jgi:hypothetical protein
VTRHGLALRFGGSVRINFLRALETNKAAPGHEVETAAGHDLTRPLELDAQQLPIESHPQWMQPE